MNPNDEKSNQNGGLPLLNSAKNVLGKNVCRDYVWGKCIRKRCNLPHTCDTETMVNILQFCHDYQNSTGCKRQNCTFLHATREEEKLFRESGQFPSDLTKRHHKMNMSRDDSYVNQPLPPPQQGPPAPQQGPSRSQQGPSRSQQGPSRSQPGPSRSQQGPSRSQGPPMIMVNPVYQSPWFLLPPPPPPREPSPPPQSYPGPPGNNMNYTPPRIDTSKPPPPLPQQLKNGSIRRLPEEEGPSAVATTTYHQPPSRPIPEMLPIDIDTTKPPPRLPSVKSTTEKRALPDTHAGPSKTRKIDTESTTCENCLHFDLRSEELEKQKKEKLKEKAILVLRYEKKKRELADIADTLDGLQCDQLYDWSMDLQDVLNDPDILLHRAKKSGAADFLMNSQVPKSQTRNAVTKDSIKNGQTSTNGPTVSAGGASHGFPSTSAGSSQSRPAPIPPRFSGSSSSTHNRVVTAYSHPPPRPPPYPMAQQAYRPVNQFNPYLPGPSNAEPQVNNPAIPPRPAVPPPYDQNLYYNMMGRPPPPYP